MVPIWSVGYNKGSIPLLFKILQKFKESGDHSMEKTAQPGLNSFAEVER